MSKIKVMDEQLSNRIAAGEVIERPASVVKELVENAIDAGATHIRIEIERAGSRLISVSDNGSGMDADDALLCIEPHGTSKIFTAEDIDRITTLGFRGEALPSIASISRFTILTRTAEMLEGTRVRIEGGRLLEAAPAGCAAGTVMQVRDLFFNTPARKKFLKSPATEAHHIEETVLGLALPRPEVGFELRIDGRTAFRSPAAPTPEARLRELFGRPFVENLWPVNHTESGITITGLPPRRASPATPGGNSGPSSTDGRSNLPRSTGGSATATRRSPRAADMRQRCSFSPLRRRRWMSTCIRPSGRSASSMNSRSPGR